MKYVVAIIRSDALDALERALMSIHVRGLTVMKVKGFGEYANFFTRDWLTEHTRVEIFAEETRVEAITNAIMDAGYSGAPGDGIVAVIPVETFLHVRTRSEKLPDDS